MSLASVQTDIDIWWEANKSFVSDAVEQYLLTHSNYFQFVWSHTVPPTMQDNGQGDTQPDNLNQLLHDQDSSMLDIVGNIPPIPVSVKNDVYENADGTGYATTLAFIYAGNGLEYWRTINMQGSDTSLTTVWHEHPPVVMP